MGEEAFELLRGAILSGTLRPGERLPVADLAEASGMSRMPIREALAQLDRDGLVETRPRCTAQVAELSAADLEDVYETRLALEVPAIAAAARKFGPEDSAIATASLEKVRRALEEGDLAEMLSAHAGFHFALYRTSSSRWFGRLIRPLWDSSERYLRAVRGIDGSWMAASMPEHERLLEACRVRDADRAALELRNHLTMSGHVLYSEMGGGNRAAVRADRDSRTPECVG